ncbi:uncharacterized protein EDB91DRAFT_1134212 [Suillus paluster]|uniref:uncharacterized protein n=1 Tax=Suillus paluster TaxID=48578 RepID=UPI001B879D88|nr:uncharacterized protein EDB91DRAFT_1134212 [Suillus paluster]KAG1739868.1 hypothetical protein EDB91DRAFT_1134212 [Suillus paluster]
MLARTCSALSEASLDVLWSELDSLHPLASCIYIANTMTLSDEHIAEAADDPKPDLSIFYKYAHRVRKLDLSGQQRFLRRGGYPSLPEDLGALLYYPLNSPILPNLRHLAWAPGMGFNLLRHLLGPHLLSLKIPAHRWSSASNLFSLTKVPGLCPKIRSLTLQVNSWDGHLETESVQSTQYISQVICSWEKLEELDCNPMTCDGVLRLSGLASLRILRLQVTTSSIVDLPPDSLSFPSLHTFQGTCSSEIIEVLLRLVSRDTLHHELRNFSLHLPPLLGDDPYNISDMLQPLFHCCELRTLSIRMTSPFTLSDGDLRMMAAAWPQLEELELIDLRPRARHTLTALTQQLLQHTTNVGPGQPNQAPQPPVVHVNQHHAIPITTLLGNPVFPGFFPPDHFFPSRSRTTEITFHGLISLLQLCPNLYYFDLALDATKLDGLQGDRPGGGVCNRLVKHAKLVDSPIGDPEVVAHILLDILPELDPLAGLNVPLPAPHLNWVPHNMTPQGWNMVRQIMLDSRNATTQSASQI